MYTCNCLISLAEPMAKPTRKPDAQQDPAEDHSTVPYISKWCNYGPTTQYHDGVSLSELHWLHILVAYTKNLKGIFLLIKSSSCEMM